MDFGRQIAHNAAMIDPVRINKYLAERGLASRREADVLIAAGQKEKKYVAYYKARGIITHSPAAHETDIETKLKSDYGLTGLHPVGRLDKDSEGLIILSNDGLITGPLLDSESKHEKEYVVTVDKEVNAPFLKKMSLGVTIEGYTTKPAKAELKKDTDKKQFILTITEGKKHQIRRMCAALGYQVQSLKRIRIINIELHGLKPNQYRTIAGKELQIFLNELNVK